MGWGGRAHGDGVGGVGRRLSPWLGWGGCTGGGPGAGALGTKEPSSPSRGCVPTGRGSLGPPGDPIAGLTAALGSETWGLSRAVSGEGSRSHLPPIPVPVATALLLLPLPQHLLQAVLQRLCLARTDPLPSALHSGGLPPILLPPSGLTPSRSHWKSSTLVLGGFLSWTLMASTVLSSPVEHPCTLPSGKASSSSWKGKNGVRSPPTRMARKGLKGCKWDWGDRDFGV